MKKIIIFLLFLLSIVFVIILTSNKVSAPQLIIKNLTEKEKEIKIIEPEIIEPITTTLLFGGDVMLSRTVNKKSRDYNDYGWPFRKLAPLTSVADLFIVNLESPFTINGNYNVPTGSFSFNADPRSVEALKIAGVDAVSLANNHALDQGAKGVRDTITVLKENNILFTGAGLNETEARTPIIIEKNNLKFGFLGYAYPDNYLVATENKAGLANLNIKKMTEDVEKLKPQVDIIVVMMHTGHEYVNRPNQQQITFAKSAVDAGADIIIGHHPHWVQNIEIYNNKPIIYSLGNLIFDQMWSRETQEGALTEIIFSDNKIKSIKIIPIIIKDYGQAHLADENISERILKRMGLEKNIIELNF